VTALRPALFIDKDGTLIENVPYNVDPAQLRFMPGALDALRQIAHWDFALILVTNQSGLARGFFNRGQLAALLRSLEQRLWEEAGIRLHDVQVCPHAPANGGRPACLCRKPAPGMLVRAARMHGIDLLRSWMVGDTLDDVEAAHRCGCRAVLLDTGGETLWRRSPMRVPEATLPDWSAFREYLEQELALSIACPGTT
jgi:D-glycero-D-manno-heptose 1,7-bisphosphate phosphatase